MNSPPCVWSLATEKVRTCETLGLEIPSIVSISQGPLSNWWQTQGHRSWSGNWNWELELKLEMELELETSAFFTTGLRWWMGKKMGGWGTHPWFHDLVEGDAMKHPQKKLSPIYTQLLGKKKKSKESFLENAMYTDIYTWLNSMFCFQDGASCKVWISKAIANLLFAHATPDCMHIQSKYVCKFWSLFLLLNFIFTYIKSQQVFL